MSPKKEEGQQGPLQKRALILGINGQDGSYLAELLLEKGYQVVGWLPVSVPVPMDNIAHLVGSSPPQIQLVKGDLTDQAGLMALIDEVRPDEVYNLAAPSFPASSWEEVILVGEVAGLGVARLLEAIRRIQPRARFYQASTSELFGDPDEAPQSERTPFHPRNPYGVAKLYAYWTVVNARKRYGLYTVNGILYNHESPRRGLEFVTRKITNTAARIKLGLADHLELGNLEARRDWGFAGDYVRAIWSMLQQEQPEDLVIGTGQTHTVREFCAHAFACLGLDYQKYVIQDTHLYRPAEGHDLVANPRRAWDKLGWRAETSFDRLIQMMVEQDLALLSAGTKGRAE